MVSATLNKAEALLTALESRNWKGVNRVISSLPSRLPKNSDSASVTTSLELTRAAADALLQACDFRTSFELSFATRKALISTPSILSWATESLQGFSFDEHVIARIAAMLGVLGMGSEGRTEVGCSGAVDQLTIVWKSHPTSVDVVKALVSLCSGHIDNVSRTMRRRGISVAVQVLSNEGNKEHTSLLEQTLIYIGLCAICTPDIAREEKALVPALLPLLEDKHNVRRPRLLQHILMALGNIVDCWTKEGFGYDLGDESRLVDAILCAWGSLRKSKDIATSSSWALGSMLVGERSESKAFQGRFEELKALAAIWKMESKTCDFLYKTAEEAIRESGSEQDPTHQRRTSPGLSAHRSNSTGYLHNSYEKAFLSVSPRRGTRKRGLRSVNQGNMPSRPMRSLTDLPDAGKSATIGQVAKIALSPLSHQGSSSDDDESRRRGNRMVERTPERTRPEGCDLLPSVITSTSKDRRSGRRKLLPVILSKDDARDTLVRRSRRQRTPSAKLSQIGHVQIQKLQRRARRIPIEIIEISSSSDGERD